MWKVVTDKGEKLPDLLVILAITVVLAAVMLPAVISSSGNAVNAEINAVAETGVMDGLVRPSARTVENRADRYSAADDAADAAASDESAEAEVIADGEPLEVTALKQMRTTDISYTVP